MEINFDFRVTKNTDGTYNLQSSDDYLVEDTSLVEVIIAVQLEVFNSVKQAEKEIDDN